MKLVVQVRVLAIPPPDILVPEHIRALVDVLHYDCGDDGSSPELRCDCGRKENLDKDFGSPAGSSVDLKT